MSSKTNQAMLAACKKILRPIVRILLRNGISFGFFHELAKKTFIDIACQEYKPKGKKQTISNIAVLTGINRKEVKRLLEIKNSPNQEADDKYNRAVKILSGWKHDPLFTDTEGVPLDLPLEGTISFATLVKKYSGDIPTMALYKTLEAAGSIRKHQEKIRLTNISYLPEGADSVDKITILGTDVAELLSTINHNLTATSVNLAYQRKVSNNNISLAALPTFRKLSAKKAQKLLEELDTWLYEHECTAEDENNGSYASMGIYYYDNKLSDGDVDVE